MSTYWLPDNIQELLKKVPRDKWITAYELNVSTKMLDRLVATGFAKCKKTNITGNPRKDYYYQKLDRQI